jgi:hypothetical protein
MGRSIFKRYAIGKKVVAAVVGIAVQFLPVDEDTRHKIAEIAIGFIVGQGIADWGKERAKVEREPPVIP